MITVDLHVHSSRARKPSQWILQKISCPESAARPQQVYAAARKKGMSHVTLTDHNSIEGALAIAHLPGVFLSEEVTAYFPEDGCKIHVLAWDICETQHEDIQKVRASVYDLADYLNRENIAHAVAHPLYAVNDRLTVSHVEKMMLLFRNFEVNGARPSRQNRMLERVLSGITEKEMVRLSEKHGMEPKMAQSWKKNLVGGSDDHSGLNVARTHTRIPGALDLGQALRMIDEGKAEVAGRASSHLAMARNPSRNRLAGLPRPLQFFGRVQADSFPALIDGR